MTETYELFDEEIAMIFSAGQSYAQAAQAEKLNDPRLAALCRSRATSQIDSVFSEREYQDPMRQALAEMAQNGLFVEAKS